MMTNKKTDENALKFWKPLEKKQQQPQIQSTDNHGDHPVELESCKIPVEGHPPMDSALTGCIEAQFNKDRNTKPLRDQKGKNPKKTR